MLICYFWNELERVVRMPVDEFQRYLVGGEVTATPISASGPWILLIAAVAIAIAIPFLTKKISFKILRS